jgi:toxin ParE1/3/4
MAIILKRPRAEADLFEIWDYIADDSETRADDFIDSVSRKFAILAERPNIGRYRGELGENIRSFPVGRYVIYYQPVQDGIEVVRILHGARDLENTFGDEE